MKKFVDIEQVRFENIDLGNGIIRYKNTQQFHEGDLIHISTKIDGSNASICYNSTETRTEYFSRNKELNITNTLNGFFEYGFNLNLNNNCFRDNPDCVFFGEWLPRPRTNKITYNDNIINKWIIYSIYNNKTGLWYSPLEVLHICMIYQLEYVEDLYFGPFISWEHCISFANSSKRYGTKQEGIVIRNVTMQNKDENGKNGWILKYVNEEFRETKKIKTPDEQKQKEKDAAYDMIGNICTENRLEKVFKKMIDEGDIPKELESKNISAIAKVYPQKVYEDCLKEEKEIITAYQEYAAKVCHKKAMDYVRKIILGG